MTGWNLRKAIPWVIRSNDVVIIRQEWDEIGELVR